jgi:L-ascorbate metabolism protein UlaG (beta-lactamase superfamily)
MRARAGILAALMAALTGSWAGASEMAFQFIGNMAFHITDGQTTLLTDFPYTPGAFGYMSYEMEAVKPVRDGLSLITHGHADHFDPKRFEAMGHAIIAPPTVLASLAAGRKVPFGEVMVFKDLEIRSFKTPHGSDHYSYLVTWHGLRLYFTGDTESTRELLAQPALDVAFVSPWLLATLEKRKERIDTKVVVVYHQRADERVPMFQGRRQLQPGEEFRLTY